MDTWDFYEGDVWFFPSNLAHTVVGLEDGCEYIAGCAVEQDLLYH